MTRYDRPRKPNTSLVLAVAGIGFVAMAGSCGIGGLVGYRLHKVPATESAVNSPPGETASRPDQTPRVMSRKDFEAAVIGKTTDEIIAAIGRPDDAKDGPSRFYSLWVYHHLNVINEVTGKPYTTIVVRIEADGRCSRAQYP